MHYVYVLFSIKLDKRYVGRTSDLKKRLEHHNNGLDRFTKKGLPWILVYYEAYLSKKDTTQRELFLKSGRGRELLNNLTKYSLELAKLVPPNRRIRKT